MIPLKKWSLTPGSMIHWSILRSNLSPNSDLTELRTFRGRCRWRRWRRRRRRPRIARRLSLWRGRCPPGWSGTSRGCQRIVRRGRAYRGRSWFRRARDLKVECILKRHTNLSYNFPQINKIDWYLLTHVFTWFTHPFSVANLIPKDLCFWIFKVF